uniref:Uncharacterized protein n=1 Tax=Lepeophtheirus salmonis TaxID=72036 RepID=A0A0K2SX41_LEPSM
MVNRIFLIQRLYIILICSDANTLNFLAVHLDSLNHIKKNQVIIIIFFYSGGEKV